MLSLEEIDYFTSKIHVPKYKIKKKIIFFCTSPWWINYMYFIANILSKSGHSIYFFGQINPNLTILKKKFFDIL